MSPASLGCKKTNSRQIRAKCDHNPLQDWRDVIDSAFIAVPENGDGRERIGQRTYSPASRQTWPARCFAGATRHPGDGGWGRPVPRLTVTSAGANSPSPPVVRPRPRQEETRLGPMPSPKRDKTTLIPFLETKVQLIIFLVCAMQARVCSAARPCSGASIIDVLSMNMTICNGEG